MNTVSRALYADLKARKGDTSEHRFAIRAYTKKGTLGKRDMDVFPRNRDAGTEEEAKIAFDRLTENNPNSKFEIIKLW